MDKFSYAIGLGIGQNLLSMGGHGALWNAIRHSDIFGAAGSMSGGVDIRPFPDNWRKFEAVVRIPMPDMRAGDWRKVWFTYCGGTSH